MGYLERCYRVIDAGGWVPFDKSTAIDLLMHSTSPAATDMVIAWLRAGRGDAKGTGEFLAKAETECEDEHELARVLHVAMRALFAVKRPEMALEAGRRCLGICRTLGMERLLSQVLITMAVITNMLGLDNVSRAYTKEALALRDETYSEGTVAKG